jgi:hypothetical protein
MSLVTRRNLVVGVALVGMVVLFGTRVKGLQEWVCYSGYWSVHEGCSDFAYSFGETYAGAYTEIHGFCDEGSSVQTVDMAAIAEAWYCQEPVGLETTAGPEPDGQGVWASGQATKYGQVVMYGIGESFCDGGGTNYPGMAPC